MSLGEFFENLLDKINEVKEKFFEISGEFTEIEFRDDIGNTAAILFVVAIAIHFFDALMGFNRSSLGALFFVLYFLFASVFYFATLPGKIVLGNLALSLGLSFASFYAPYLVILISKYFPMILIFLVFTPIWPMFILLKFYGESNVLRGIGFTISIIWTVAFLAYFYNHFPTQAKNVFYERAINVKEPAWKLIKGVYTNIATAGIKIYNDLTTGISKSIDNFMNRMMMVAMGQTETQETQQVQPREKIGLYIENVYLTLDEYPKDIKPQIFFTVSSYNLVQKLNVRFYCYAELIEAEKKDEKGNKETTAKKSSVEGASEKGKKETKKFFGEIEALTDSSFKGHRIFWHDQTEDFSCVLPNSLEPGKYKVIVGVKFNETAASSLPVYLISFKMYTKIRAQGKDFFSAYNLPKPRAQQNNPTAAIINLGFKSQPLIESTPNTLSINIIKSDKWESGEIEKFYLLQIDPKKLSNYIASVKGIKMVDPKIVYWEEEGEKGKIYEISPDVMTKFSKSFGAQFLIMPKRISKELISSDLVVFARYQYDIHTEKEFKVLDITAGTLVEKKNNAKGNEGS